MSMRTWTQTPEWYEPHREHQDAHKIQGMGR